MAAICAFFVCLTRLLVSFSLSFILRAYYWLIKTVSIFGSFSIGLCCIVVALTTSLTGGTGEFMLFDQFVADPV
jgi:hypothetical protein